MLTLSKSDREDLVLALITLVAVTGVVLLGFEPWRALIEALAERLGND